MSMFKISDRLTPFCDFGRYLSYFHDSHRIANERKAIRAWLRAAPPGSRLAMESTGSYHELLAELAHRAGLPAVGEAAHHISTIPGIGALTSMCLGNRFTKVPYATSDAVVASPPALIRDPMIRARKTAGGA